MTREQMDWAEREIMRRFPDGMHVIDIGRLRVSVMMLCGQLANQVHDTAIEDAAKIADIYVDASEKCGEPGPDDAYSIAYAIRALKVSR